MYRAGVSLERVARVSGESFATVRRCIGWMKRTDPDLQLEHDRNAPPPRPEDDPRFPAWRTRWEQARTYVETHGEGPMSRADDPAARSIAAWLGVQRHRASQGKLDTARLELMEQIPGWQISQNALRAQERWDRRLADLAWFLQLNGHLPSFHAPRSTRERTLALWLQHQRTGLNLGSLPPTRETQLDEVVPEWRVDRRRDRSLGRYGQASETLSGASP